MTADLTITIDDLTGPEIAALLDEHVQHMRGLTPLEHAYALDLDDLRQPEITFWTVHSGTELVGCGALKELDPSHGEIKSMRTRATRTRGGVASRLLTHIIDEATTRGYTRLSLETGTDDNFLAARKLYEKFGFVPCGPFDGYKPSPHNTFMTKPLA